LYSCPFIADSYTFLIAHCAGMNTVPCTPLNKLHNLYSSKIIAEDEIVRKCDKLGEMPSAYRILVGKCEVKKSLGRPKDRWEDNIKLILKKCDVRIRTRTKWLR
jgi:hypothetical protein